MFSFWVTIKIPFLDHLIFVQGFCSCGFPREAVVYRVLTLIPHGIRVFWDALGSLFCGPPGLLYYARATLALRGNIFLCLFVGPLGPNLTSFHYVLYFSVTFFLWSFSSFYFLCFLLQMLKQLPVGRLAFYFVRSFGSLPLILELITQLLIIVNHFV